MSSTGRSFSGSPFFYTFSVQTYRLAHWEHSARSQLRCMLRRTDASARHSGCLLGAWDDGLFQTPCGQGVLAVATAQNNVPQQRTDFFQQRGVILPSLWPPKTHPKQSER